MTNEYDYHARMYSPDRKQFLQVDKLMQNVYNPMDLNHYAFIRNNPYLYIDPTGRGVLFFDGGSGSTGGGPDGGLAQMAQELDKSNIDTKVVPRTGTVQDGYDYATHNLAKGEPLVIVGHSLGGTKALQLQKRLEAEGYKVARVITLDPFDEADTIPGVRSVLDDQYTEKNWNYWQFSSIPVGKPLAGARNTLVKQEGWPGAFTLHSSLDSDPDIQSEILREARRMHEARKNIPTGLLNTVGKVSASCKCILKEFKQWTPKNRR